jgi:hypothetical protein
VKVTHIETFAVDTGFKPPRPWLFCAIRTDEGVTGYSEDPHRPRLGDGAEREGRAHVRLDGVRTGTLLDRSRGRVVCSRHRPSGARSRPEGGSCGDPPSP